VRRREGYDPPVPDTRKLTVLCPDCEGRLTVDAETGAVLSHEKKAQPIAGGADFDQLLGEIDRGKEKAEEIFEKEVAAHEDRDRLLDEKFREAVKRAESEPDDTPPRRPFDYE